MNSVEGKGGSPVADFDDYSASTTSASAECKDKGPPAGAPAADCAGIKAAGLCKVPVAAQFCAKTCGICT